MSEMLTPFCDHLTVTFGPDEHPQGPLELFIQSLGCYRQVPRTFTETRRLWRAPDGGTLVIDLTARFVSISSSGSFLAYLRGLGRYFEYLTILSHDPYSVTRLDATYDEPVDAAPVVLKLARRFRRGIQITRKTIGTRWVLGTRSTDDVVSGTFYAGKRGSGVLSLSVYDKQKERMDKEKIEIGPCLRYELSFHKAANCSLKDAADPAPLFWHFASPKLLEAPRDRSLWHPSGPDDLGWTHPMTPILPYQVLKRRIEDSPELAALIALADRVGPQGRRAALRMLGQRFDTESPSEDLTAVRTTAREEDQAVGSSG